MVVGSLLVDGTYLQAMVVADFLVLVVSPTEATISILQKVAIMVLQKVVVLDLKETKIQEYMLQDKQDYG
jgi:hypothetical protein